ncbi:hypothetical protein CG723_13780 [Streptomyces sp. CB01635]|nr:hypothetical protein CG723_13780 [Streptomyces sp. CB01635]
MRSGRAGGLVLIRTSFPRGTRSAPGRRRSLAPLTMSYPLVRGSGKPLLELRHAAERPGHAAYAARTNSFVPRPPERGP